VVDQTSGSSAAGSGSAGEAAVMGWIIDAQEDLMRPDGRFYIRDLNDDSDPGAAEVIPALKTALEWMRENCALMVFTGGWHGLEDPLIDALNPDPARGTYPPHSMGRSPNASERAGAEVVSEIRPHDPLILPHDAVVADAEAIAERAIRESRPVFVRKAGFDVFEGNPGTGAFLRAVSRRIGGDGGPAPRLLVAGVPRDLSVSHAVSGMNERGYDVTVLKDTTWGLGLEAEADTLARWAGEGSVTTLGELGAGSAE